MYSFGDTKYPSTVETLFCLPSNIVNKPEAVGETTPKSVTNDVITVEIRISAAFGLRSTIEFAASFVYSEVEEVNEKFGIYVQPIFYPTVPKDSARLRITITPKHSTHDIDDLVDALATVTGKIIPKSQSAKSSHQFSSTFV